MSEKRKSMIIGVILIAAGLIVALAAMIMTGFDFSKYGSYANLERAEEAASAEGVNEIVIDTKQFGISVIPKETDEIRIEYAINDEMGYEFTNSNGVYRMKYYSKKKWYDYIQMFNFEPSGDLAVIKVFIPEDFAGKLTLKTSYGEVDVHDLSELTALEIVNSYDTATVTGVAAAGDIVINNSYGRIEAEDWKAGGNIEITIEYKNLTMESVSAGNDIIIDERYGKITADGLTAGGRLDIRNQYGGMEIRNAFSEGDQILKNSYGDIEVEQLSGNGSLKMTNSYDPIEFSEIRFDEVEIVNSYGKIKGEMAGSRADYRIINQIKDGKSNLEEKPEGEKLLSVKNSYSNIDITFEEE